MALLAKAPRVSTASRFGVLAAGIVPVLYGWSHAAANGYLADTTRFLEQSLAAEPNAFGAPALLLARLCALIPLGSLSLRIALASSLALGLAAVAVYRAIDTLLRAQAVANEALVASVALGLAWLFAGQQALFAQALLPGAYALQVALALFCLCVPHLCDAYFAR